MSPSRYFCAYSSPTLSSHSAVLFAPTLGDYVGRTFLVVDGDGDGNYLTGMDYVIEVTNPVMALGMGSAIFV